MSEETKEDEEEKEEEKKDDSEDASLACAELLRLALLSKDLSALSKATTTTRLSEDGEVKQLQRGGEEFREILMRTTKNTNTAIRCSVIVLVFSMNNCQPCVQFAPKLDRLAKEYKDLHVGFVKCNIHESDMNRRLANEAGVFWVPVRTNVRRTHRAKSTVRRRRRERRERGEIERGFRDARV